MSTHEARLTSVEYDLKQFKTETIKAYQDVAMELTMIKGLTEDSVRRLMTLKTQIDQRFDVTDQRLNAIERRFDIVDQRFTSLDEKLDQVLQRLSNPPATGK